MLFNTLAYARFFAIVFVVAWALVRRRNAAFLPWFALAGYAAFLSPSPTSVGLPALGLALTFALSRRAGRDEIPPVRVALASIAVNFTGLCFLTFEHAGRDPVTLALAGLGLELERYLPVGPASISYAALPAGAACLFLLVRASKVRLLFILFASYVFYAQWDWRFLPLIFLSSSFDWFLGNAIARESDPRLKKRWLIATAIVNMGVLAVFKYFNFGVDSARAMLEAFGYHPPELALRVALPVGISFFTFESMSYVIDVYRGDIQPQKSYFEYLSFVAFFPHLVAGPIVRPRDLLPQLAGPARFSAREGSEGLFLIAVGLIKKVAIGDYLAVNLIDRVWDMPPQYSSLECYTAVVSYAIQIYCDFSGYTDIAIGSALLLGVRFPLNFDSPFKAPDIQDYWRRWHISLSTWLRDYLYVPLGGNRKGEARTYFNLFLTMLLGGLWHGAGWTYVVWGALHGSALVAHRFWDRVVMKGRSRRPVPAHVLEKHGSARAGRSLVGYWVSVCLTFHLIGVGWVLFRSESFQKASLFFDQLAELTFHHGNLHPEVLAVLAVGLVSHYLPERWYVATREAFIRSPAVVQGVLLFCVALVLREMASADAVPFVYFQF